MTTFAGNEAMPTGHFDELRDKITEHAGFLVSAAHRILRATAVSPTAYVLPATWDPGPDPDAYHPVDQPPVSVGKVFGKPVMWDPEERMGLFYEVEW